MERLPTRLLISSFSTIHHHHHHRLSSGRLFSTRRLTIIGCGAGLLPARRANERRPLRPFFCHRPLAERLIGAPIFFRLAETRKGSARRNRRGNSRNSYAPPFQEASVPSKILYDPLSCRGTSIVR